MFLVQNSFLWICKNEGVTKLPPFSIYNYLHIPPHEIYNLFFRENNENVDATYNIYFQFIVSFGLLEMNELILILLSCCSLHYSVAIPPSKLLVFFNIIGIDSDNLNTLNDFISKCPHNMDGKIEINNLINFIERYPSLINPIIQLKHKIWNQILTMDKINEIQNRYTFYRNTGHLYFSREIIKKLYFPRTTSCCKKINNLIKNLPDPYYCDYFPTFVGESLNTVISLLRTKYGLQYSARAQSLRIKSIQIDGESYSFPKLYAVGNRVDRRSSTSPLSHSLRNNTKRTIGNEDNSNHFSYNNNTANNNAFNINRTSGSVSVSINHSSILKDGNNTSSNTNDEDEEYNYNNSNNTTTATSTTGTIGMIGTNASNTGRTDTLTNSTEENTAINTLANSNRNSVSVSPMNSSYRDSTTGTVVKSRAIPIFQGVKIVPTNS